MLNQEDQQLLTILKIIYLAMSGLVSSVFWVELQARLVLQSTHSAPVCDRSFPPVAPSTLKTKDYIREYRLFLKRLKQARLGARLTQAQIANRFPARYRWCRP